MYLLYQNFKQIDSLYLTFHQYHQNSLQIWWIWHKLRSKVYNTFVYRSSVTLGNLFDFFLLLKSVWWLLVALFTVDDFVSQTFSNGLVVSHWVLSGSVSDQVNSQVDSSHWWDVNGLLSGNTSRSDLGGVFSWASELDGSDEDFQWVSACQKVDDFECVSDDSDGLDLFTGVSAVELEWSDESFYDGGECLSEFFSLISSSSMWYEDLRSGRFDSDVVFETWIIDLKLKKQLLGNRRSSIWRRALGRSRIRVLMIFIRLIRLFGLLTFVVKDNSYLNNI